MFSELLPKCICKRLDNGCYGLREDWLAKSKPGHSQRENGRNHSGNDSYSTGTDTHYLTAVATEKRYRIGRKWDSETNCTLNKWVPFLPRVGWTKPVLCCAEPVCAQECQLLCITLEARLLSDCVSADVVGRVLGTVLHVLLVSDTGIDCH